MSGSSGYAGGGVIPAGQGNLDEVSGGLTSINFEHHEMHEGNHYFYKNWLINTGNADTFDTFSFTAPSLPVRVHAKASIVADADVIIQIFEGSEVSGGTPIDGFNNDRASLNVAQLSALAGPSIDVEGVEMWPARNGGNRTPIGVGLGFNYEIIVAPDTVYSFRITKKTSADTVIDVDFYWYEHSPSE